MAAQGGHAEVAAALLERKADVDAAANNGVTPVIIAAHNGDLQMVTVLCKAGAKLEHSFASKTALQWAELLGHSAVAKYLRGCKAT